MQTHPGTRPWHEADDWRAQAARRRLSAREIALVDRYRTDGFAVVEDARILDGIDTEAIWARQAQHFAEDHSGRVQDAWATDPAVRAIAIHPAVLDVLRLLYGREPYPFQTLNFLSGTEQRTHSDTIHFSSLPSGFMCGVWMALEDITLRQGPLHYFPGSHTLPEFDYEHLGIAPVVGEQTWTNPSTRAAYSAYEERIDAVARENGFRRDELAIARGTFLIWSANLLHGGSPREDRTVTRKSQVTHYYFADAVPFTPMFSRRTEGRYAVRRVRDIRTGKWTVPSLDGAPVVFPDGGGDLRTIRAVEGPGAQLVRETMRLHGGLPVSARNAFKLAGQSIAGKLRR